MPTPPTLNIALQNTTSSNNVFAYIAGRALDNSNALFLLRRDGRTPYFPISPSSTLSALAEDCSIRLGAPGSTTTVTIPHLAGARIYFSVDGQLTFLLNPGPALVEPSVSNPSDPNFNLNWTFAEFTYNNTEIYANITYVDFVSIPVSLTLTTTSNTTQHVSGMPSDGLSTVCARLQAQDNSDHAGWSRLIVKAPNSDRLLRALSPNTGIVMDRNLFRGYYQPYVDAVWAKYTTDTLAINTQNSQWGTVVGQVRNGVFDFSGGHLFTQPSAADIFSCSTGPFAEMGSPARGAIIARFSAAFHRSTLLRDRTIPDTPPPFYAEPITNHYSRIVHEVNLDRRGYAFPYDDVSATGDRDVSGAVVSDQPTLLTVAIGGGGAFASASGVRDERDEL
jgi:Beta-1,3-glucanase